MSGSFGDMGNLLKQAQLMQKEMDRVRDELRAQTVEGVSTDGLVKAEVGGDRQVRAVSIEPELAATGDAARIQSSVLAAIRDATEKADALREASLSRVTGGMNLPGLF
jgi:hypothetical protein